MAESTLIVAGADTRADTIHVAAVTMTGAAIGDREFSTTRAGYAPAMRFLASLGQVQRIGVEGTATCGAGLPRIPNREPRQVKPASDPADGVSSFERLRVDDPGAGHGHAQRRAPPGLEVPTVENHAAVAVTSNRSGWPTLPEHVLRQPSSSASGGMAAGWRAEANGKIFVTQSTSGLQPLE
ncbi:IS110 family transposase [Mycobacterium ostraviense]|uniref:IS110 family transposase n=1 Tax=Mycobacterium ostraviense TaxID=2738409 RepID=UPI000A769F3C|nr:IS110 family transposase [Mycobacterium ostraviense]UGT90290.1 hypothetical protein LTS72_18290 [Mycobacterium ostraviense]